MMNKMVKKILAAGIMAGLLAGGTAYAQKPVYVSEDAEKVGSRLTFDYLDDSLFHVNTQVGYVTDIELKPGETVTYIAGGDTTRWMIDKSMVANVQHIYIKPTAKDITTNVIVNTNLHSYRLEVSSTDHYDPLVTFRFHDTPKVKSVLDSGSQSSLAAIRAGKRVDGKNYDYRIKAKSTADVSLMPSEIFDDGTKTYIKMKDTNKYDLPVIYAIDPWDDKTLSMVNYRRQGDYFVIDRVIEHGRLFYHQKFYIDFFNESIQKTKTKEYLQRNTMASRMRGALSDIADETKEEWDSLRGVPNRDHGIRVNFPDDPSDDTYEKQLQSKREKELAERQKLEKQRAAQMEQQRLAQEKARQAQLKEQARLQKEREAQIKKQQEIRQAEIKKQEEARLAQIEAQRIAQEKAVEAQRIAQEKARQAQLKEQARIQKEREAQIRKQQEEAKRIEAERQAKLEAQRREQERLEKERLAKIEAQRVAEEKARQERIRLEKERQAKLEAERIAAEKLRIAQQKQQEKFAQERQALEQKQREAVAREQERLARERQALLERQQAEAAKLNQQAPKVSSYNTSGSNRQVQAANEVAARRQAEAVERQRAQNAAAVDAQKKAYAAERNRQEQLRVQEAKRIEAEQKARAAVEREQARRMKEAQKLAAQNANNQQFPNLNVRG